jgi:hypothetical protein
MTQEERRGWNRFKYSPCARIFSQKHPVVYRTCDQLGGTGQILPLHVFLEMPRRTTQERSGSASYRVQRRTTRSGMGLPAHTSHPLSRLFACFAGPIPQAKRGHFQDHGWDAMYGLCRAADFYGAVSIIKRCCPAETGENSLHNTEWTLPPRVAQTCISIFIDSTIATG